MGPVGDVPGVWEDGPAERPRVTPVPVTRTRPPSDPASGYGPAGFEWMAAQGEGPRPGQARVTGGRRLAWLAGLLVLAVFVLVAVAA
jgi:hypothetical protein